MRDFIKILQDNSEKEQRKHSPDRALKQLTLELLELEEENSILHGILSSLFDPILITSSTGSIIYVNKAWEELTGYTFREVEGKNPEFLSSSKTTQKLYKGMWKKLSKAQTFSVDSLVDKKKNGDEIILHLLIYPIFQGTEVKYFVQIAHDRTNEVQREELRREFLSASAHELKTPITVLKLLIETHIAKAEKKGDESIKKNELELINKELNKLIRLIDDILDTSRFEQGRLYMSYEMINLSKLLKETVEKVKMLAKHHSLILSVPEEVIVRGDLVRLEQVIVNLLSNAVKYSPENTTVTIRLVVKNKQAIISVQDQGIGIPKKNQTVIFDKYYQVKSKSRVGFGLGLYISKEIVKRHHGRIWVESSKNKGSTFYFTLPLTT